MSQRGASPIRLSELAAELEREFVGEKDPLITGVAPLDAAGAGDLAFVRSEAFADAIPSSGAAALIVPPEIDPRGRPAMLSPNPSLDFARAVARILPAPVQERGVHRSAFVADSAAVDPNASVGPNSVVGERCIVGPGSVLHANVTLYPDVALGADCRLHSGVVVREGCELGDRVSLQPGVVIGGDGFGYVGDGGRHHKIPQVGRVVIEDDVEIGANTAIDRGAMDDTVIGAGSKIDDLVMVAHGVRLGRGALLAAQTGIAGSTRVGEFSTFAGQSGVAGHLTLGDKTVVAAKSAALSDFPMGGIVAGIPAVDHRQWKRAQVAFRKLPELRKEVGDLRRLLADLERRLEEVEDRS